MRINGFEDKSLTVSMSKNDPETTSRPPRTGFAETKGVAQSSDGGQLSTLSSVLNGLENGASAIRRHVQQAMRAVRGGTYQVDSLQLSKRIVGEALGSA
ncbi:MAG TPA: hypothetical protein VHU83_01510 [Bryobacteraceae bacterium]|jgi:hypothetical protein|nr:hypothetical protein [Bryobacteraceae bacterium]